MIILDRADSSSGGKTWWVKVPGVLEMDSPSVRAHEMRLEGGVLVFYSQKGELITAFGVGGWERVR